MFDKLSYDITNPVPDGFDLNMDELMDITKMPLEELEDYLDGLRDSMDGMEPGDKRIDDLKTLMAEVADLARRLKEIVYGVKG